MGGSTYTLTVGSGGLGSTASGTRGGNGDNSIFGSITNLGGGGGGSYSGNQTGSAGGSGGGGACVSYAGGSGTSPQGYAGGTGAVAGASYYAAGGGGGANGAGANGNSAVGGGAGGEGKSCDISGTTVWYAGGGGGGAYGGIQGTNGVGGGGMGGNGSLYGINGLPNTGGGGGGAGFNVGVGKSGNGGSGIVIVRYPYYSDGLLSVTLTSPTPGQSFPLGSSISPMATVLDGTSPYTVTFYTNHAGGAYGPAGSANSSPYTVNLGALAAGTYGVYASVTDNALTPATAFSVTNTFTVYVPPTRFFWTSTATGIWGTPANWTNDTGVFTAPVAAGQTNYAINFNQSGIYTVTHDLNNGFMLNQLNFGGATLTLQGNSLALTHDGVALPQINQNSSNAVAISTALILGTNVTFGGSGTGLVTLSSAMSGRGSLTKDGAGTLKLTAVNPYAGGTVVNNGTLELVPTGAGASGAVSGNLTINSNATVIANSGWALGYGGSLNWTGPSVSSITNNGGTLSFKDAAVNGGTSANTITLNGGTINLTGSPSDSNFDWYYGYTTTPTLRTLASVMRSTVNCGIELRLGSDAGVLTFDVAAGSTSDGIDLLVSGAIITGSGGSVTKTGSGTLLLAGKNTYTGATTVREGTLMVVAGGSCSNSAVTVTNAPGITSALGVLVTNNVQQWTCSNLTFKANGTGAQLKFSFAVTPSTNLAPLNITSGLVFSNNVAPLVVVDSANLRMGTYPLLVAGGAAPSVVPTLSMTGQSGVLSWGGAGNRTLFLSITGGGTVLMIQ